MTLKSFLLAAAMTIASATASLAVTINFDEFAPDNVNGPMPANRYASLGVTFDATDDGTTWGGISLGDPGNWDLEGTNGSVFMGMNGTSYGLTMNFNSAITGFSLDAARSLGSTNGDKLTVEGYLNNALVDSVSIVFGAVNDWSVFALNGVFDSVKLVGMGTGFSPYGVDNVNWERANVIPVPAALPLLLAGLGAFGFLRRRQAS